MRVRASSGIQGERRDEPARPWNLNIHYDQLLAHLASSGDRVLDVGCGDGFLSAQLISQGCDVVGLDADAGVLHRARRRWPDERIEWRHADLLDSGLAPASFDVVLSNAMLHHLPDTAEALTTMADFVRPGGTLGIVGFARNGPLDWPMSLAGSVGIFMAVRIHGKWEHTAPQAWPPPHTYGQMRSLSRKTLPECSFRRLWMGRYLMTWHKPEHR